MSELLVVWETPFRTTSNPSVIALPGSSEGELTVRIDADNKYEIRFSSCASFKSTSETIFPLEHFNNIAREGDSCTYIWKASPWLQEFEQVRGVVKYCFGSDDLQHYVILGGDQIVEALAAHPPEIASA